MHTFDVLPFFDNLFRAGRDSADSEAVPAFSSLEAILWVAVAVATFNGVALMVRNTLLHFSRVLRDIERITGRIGTPAVWLAHRTFDKPVIWFGHGCQTRVSISVLPHSRASGHACSHFKDSAICASRNPDRRGSRPFLSARGFQLAFVEFDSPP